MQKLKNHRKEKKQRAEDYISVSDTEKAISSEEEKKEPLKAEPEIKEEKAEVIETPVFDKEEDK